MSPSLFPLSLILLFTLLCTSPTPTHALPPPSPPTNLLNLTSLISLTNPKTLTNLANPTNQTSPPHLLHLPTCIPKRGVFTPCPNYYDCAQAIFKLPDLNGHGAFHNGAPDDVFRLPVSKTSESCRVRVELVHEGSAKESASWHVIVARALVVAEACINTPLRAPEFAGGWTVLGKHKRLTVILEHSSAGGGGGGSVDDSGNYMLGIGGGNGSGNVTVL